MTAIVLSLVVFYLVFDLIYRVGTLWIARADDGVKIWASDAPGPTSTPYPNGTYWMAAGKTYVSHGHEWTEIR